MAKKMTRKAVLAASADYGRAMTRFGENDLETVRRLGDYQAARRRWEQDHGRPWDA
jgi:hypothetical protein